MVAPRARRNEIFAQGARAAEQKSVGRYCEANAGKELSEPPDQASHVYFLIEEDAYVGRCGRLEKFIK